MRCSVLAETGKKYDLLLKNVRVVRPDANAVYDTDIAITGGKFSRIAASVDSRDAKRVYEGKGLLAFPGVVDAHMHTGIYSPLAEDAVSESRAAAQGGVTTSLNYFRSGQYYLNRAGRIRRSFRRSSSSPRAFHVDLRLPPRADGYHADFRNRHSDRGAWRVLSKISCSTLARLHGRSDSQRDFLMIADDERYDYAHFEFVMRGVQAARERLPGKAAQISCRCTAKPPRS